MLKLHYLSNQDAKLIRFWLIFSAFALFLMVIIGGATRLTGSGLSMVEWEPLNFFPPITDNDWLIEFKKYQTSPEFKLVNTWMEIADFKRIFWLEYFHRLWGRIIGLIFVIPFLYFCIKGKISRSLTVILALLIGLGGAQGLLGWYMVQSGLVLNPEVSQYRLAAHLSLAFIIFGIIMWIIPSIKNSDLCVDRRTKPLPRQLFYISILSSFMIFFVVISGAFVAGLDAGLAYNTFPLMGDKLIPDGLYDIHPWYINWFENTITVQFNHRLFAILLAILIITTSLKIVKSTNNKIKNIAIILIIFVILQVSLGISTLLYLVPIWLAICHQACALILFSISVILSRYIYNESFF